jgi:RNase P/RNase MRP subunit p29
MNIKNRKFQIELIGKRAKVAEIDGTIIDETKNMIVLRDQKGNKKRFIKKSHTFMIKLEGKYQEIKGKEINLRPEERIKIKSVKR